MILRLIPRPRRYADILSLLLLAQGRVKFFGGSLLACLCSGDDCFGGVKSLLSPAVKRVTAS